MYQEMMKMKKQKVIHIKGKLKPRLCGSIGDYASVGDNDEIPTCQRCIEIKMRDEGVME